MITDTDIVVTAPRYRRISPVGLALITRRETFRAVAYDDFQPKRASFPSVASVRGTPTIGFGHVEGVTKQDVVNGRTCTMEQALAWKAEDLAVAYQRIERVMGRAGVWRLTDEQYDALVSFAFNCGLDPKWQISKLLRQGRFSEVPDQMIRFVFSKGQRMQGLVDRRREEIDLFRSDHVVATNAEPGDDVHAQPTKPLLQSRTFIASLLAAFSGMGGALTAATESLTPYADNVAVHGMIVAFTIVGTLSGLYAAYLKAQDQMGARA